MAVDASAIKSATVLNSPSGCDMGSTQLTPDVKWTDYLSHDALVA
jgi:hypothetical protein